MCNKKLGKQPPRHDPRTYRVTAPDRHQIPDVCDYSRGIKYDMLGNDKAGDCVFASRGHLLLTWTTHAQAPLRINATDALTDYADVTGYNPQTGANDNGTVMLDAMKRWQRNGYTRPGQTRDYLTHYASIQPTDTRAIKRAVYGLGGIMAGIQVPSGFMSLPAGRSWDMTQITDTASVGGHCIPIVGYTPYGIYFVTWGERTFMPWETFAQIADECWLVMSRENWTQTDGLTPLGLEISV